MNLRIGHDDEHMETTNMINIGLFNVRVPWSLLDNPYFLCYN